MKEEKIRTAKELLSINEKREKIEALRRKKAQITQK